MSIELVDQDLCNGCGLCVITCPLDVIRLDTEVADRAEEPPCRLACPAGVDMRGYMYLLKNGQIEEAMQVIRESLPLPAVTGRVCPHPCESDCARREVDEAVNINSMERFVADQWLSAKPEPAQKVYSAKVAVVGSGPAGLSAAYFLVRAGYPVTVFEAQGSLGGMMRLGIPEYRLSREVLGAQIDYIKHLGVEFKTKVTVGKDVTLEKLQKEYQAVFWAAGSQLSRRLEIEGADLEGVLWGVEYLAGVNRGKGSRVEGKVVVIGGGNVAMDVALTALHAGAETVELVCLEQEGEMPAFDDEVEQALEEGVRMRCGWGPKRLVATDGRVSGVELVWCTSVYDDRRQFCPAYDETNMQTIEADTVILAVGQAVDLALLPEGLKTTKGGTVQVDAITLATSLPGVFAGGDLVTGPASVVQAIAAGKRASESIERFLKKQDMKAGRELSARRVPKLPKEGIETAPRNPTPRLAVGDRPGGTQEIKLAFDEDTADREAKRCMTCGSRAAISYVQDCMLCLHCEHYCPQKAIFVSPDKKVAPLVPWA